MASRSSKKKRSSAQRSGRPGGRTVQHGASSSGHVRKARFGDWVRAARPATLGLAVAPVLLGWGVAVSQFLLLGVNAWDSTVLIAVALCFTIAIALQIGVNFANDYSDGIRGTDNHRVGPAPLTATRTAPATRVRLVAFIFFGIAALAGLGVTVLSEIWWLPAVGLTAILAAWFYTGGKRPYGYAGLGEVMVFIFFGLVATTGTTYILASSIGVDSILAGVAMGLFSVAVLFINNVRDRETDIAAGKRTLSTRMPLWLNRAVFTALIAGPFGILIYFAMLVTNAWWAYFALFIAVPAILITWTARQPREYVLVLKLTVWTSLFYAAIVAWSFAL